MRRISFLLALAAALVLSTSAQASHSTWGTLGFDSYDATTNSSATCGEASLYTAVSINAIYAGNPVTGGVKENCPGPHPNGSAKYQQWVNAAGNRIFDCLYDEDPTLIEVECRDFQNFRPPWPHTGWLEFEIVDEDEPNNGSISCGEANLWSASVINTYIPNGITGGSAGNCAGPHPNGSAKWSQWVNAAGTRLFDCLSDEDPPDTRVTFCRGPGTANGYYNLAR